jgi:hypothetical protein
MCCIPALWALMVVVYTYPPKWTVRHNTFHDSCGQAFLIVVACGFVSSLLGLRYRNGTPWMIVWLIVALASGILMPALAET